MPKYSQYPGESKERFKVRMARQAAQKGKYKDTNGDAAALIDVASVLSGSKTKSSRTKTKKPGRRRLYT